MTFFDIHTHRRVGDFAVWNCTLPRDAGEPWPAGGQVSVGLHPWFTPTDWRPDFEVAAALARRPEVVLVGECGLDRPVSARLPMATQEAILEAHLGLAADVGKPILFHCVRAHEDLIRVLARGGFGGRGVVHGFNAKPVLAEKLLAAGLYLSLGKALLHPESNAATALRLFPSDRFFFETDDADVDISEVYAAAGGILGVSAGQVAKLADDNREKFFGVAQ